MDNINNNEDFCSLKNFFLFTTPEVIINNDLIKPKSHITITKVTCRKVGAFKQIYINFKSNTDLLKNKSYDVGTIQSTDYLTTGIPAFGGSNKAVCKITSGGSIYIVNVSDSDIPAGTIVEASFLYL